MFGLLFGPVFDIVRPMFRTLSELVLILSVAFVAYVLKHGFVDNFVSTCFEHVLGMCRILCLPVG